MSAAGHLLEVQGLAVEFHTAGGTVHAVNGVDWHVDSGEVLAILGESGSGKSVSAAAIMNLIDSPPGYVTAGRILYRGEDLLTDVRRGAPAHQRPPDRDDLPGPARASEPGVQRRLADRRDADGARRGVRARGEGARDRAARPGRHRGSRSGAPPTTRTSSRAGSASG